MARNPLSSTRQDNELFQKDVVKNNRERGNQGRYNRKKFRIKNLIAFLSGFLIGYILFSLFIGLIHFVFALIQKSLGFSNENPSYFSYVIKDAFSSPTTFIIGVFALIFGMFVWIWHLKHGKKEAVVEDHSDINTYTDDRRKLTLEEMFTQYEVVPDAGAVSKSIEATSIVSHAFIKNTWKMKKVKMVERDENDQIKYDNNGKPKLKTYDMFDEQLQKESYESVGIIDEQEQVKIDPFKVKYKKDEKGNWITLGEFINEDWELPETERQRPAGVFFVETAPVNTAAIAITRGGKGQTYVNHTIDTFSRQYELQNMFINDPKGELFSAFHKLLEYRGYEPIALNLMDPSKTHQFNVLGPAIAMARIGDYDKMRDLLNTTNNAFFPIEGDDPFWGQAQQALVKMILFSLIDYYLEEEREYLQKWSGVRDESTIGRDLDEMWGKVTMFNTYQMLTTMTRKEVLFCEKAIENGDLLTKEEIQKIQTGVPDIDEKGNEIRVPFVSDNGYTYPPNSVEQMTQLTAFFKLIDYLPKNKMRTITLQQSDAINLMAQSEKTLATVYGIALVAMLFFTNGPITAITSASPRQSLDPLSLAFPRRLRFKINNSFLKAHKLIGRKVKFEAYRDAKMEDQILTDKPEDFLHETRLDVLGWVEFRFKGIFEEYEEIEEYDGTITKIPKPIYIKMKIIDDNTGYSMYTFNYEFMRGYAKTVDGRRFIQNPRTGQRIEQGGTLRLGEYDEKQDKFVRKQEKSLLPNGMKVLPIEQTDAVYNIRPKAIFSLTPPNLADYIKVALVMVSVLFDTSVGESYITKANGKPFYKTRSILDELGNMQFAGHGISNFETKLSIGLGQGQEYTMILQTLQQLRDVYGDSVDKIVQSNTAVFVYLISNDSDMLEELSKQAGTTHVSRAKQKTINKDVDDFVDKIDSNVGYQITTEEEPLFSVNELMSFTNGENMVLSSVHRKDNSGESVRPNPIHNTRETLMPMAYALHKNGHNSKHFKRELQNVEVATSSSDRDVYREIPNFTKLYEKRLVQATLTNNMIESYKEQHNLSDEDLINRDVDEVSESIMRLINNQMTEMSSDSKENEGANITEQMSDAEKAILDKQEIYENMDISAPTVVVDKEDRKYQKDISKAEEKQKEIMKQENELIFVDNTLSLNHLKQASLVQTVLGQALDQAKITTNKVNKDIYSLISQNGNKKILHIATDTIVAEFNFDLDEVGEQETAWFVTDEFIQLALNSASKEHVNLNNNESSQQDLDRSYNASNVDELFNFDNSGMVKNKFIDMFKKEVSENGEH